MVGFYCFVFWASTALVYSAAFVVLPIEIAVPVSTMALLFALSIYCVTTDIKLTSTQTVTMIYVAPLVALVSAHQYLFFTHKSGWGSCSLLHECMFVPVLFHIARSVFRSLTEEETDHLKATRTIWVGFLVHTAAFQCTLAIGLVEAVSEEVYPPICHTSTRNCAGVSFVATSLAGYLFANPVVRCFLRDRFFSVPLDVVRDLQEFQSAGGGVVAKGSDGTTSSGLLDEVSDMSSDDAFPSVSNNDKVESILDTPVFSKCAAPELVPENANPELASLQCLYNKQDYAVQFTARRRARYECHKVIFPTLRRASKGLANSKSPFSMLPKDIVRHIAWMCVDNRCAELHALFTSLDPFARQRDLLMMLT